MAFAPPRVAPAERSSGLTPLPPMADGGSTPRRESWLPATSTPRRSWTGRSGGGRGSTNSATFSTGFNSGRDLVQAEDVFVVQVRTTADEDAGTDSNIYIRLHGINGSTDEIPLVEYTKTGDMQVSKTPFGRDTKSSFQTRLKHGNIGEIERVTVRLDDKTGTSPSWHLHTINVEAPHSVRSNHH